MGFIWSVAFVRLRSRLSAVLVCQPVMYYPVGWPKVLKASRASKGKAVEVFRHRSKSLIVELRGRSVGFWHSRVSLGFSWFMFVPCVSVCRSGFYSVLFNAHLLSYLMHTVHKSYICSVIMCVCYVDVCTPPPPVVYTGGLIHTLQQVCGAARSQHDCRPQTRRLCPRCCGEPLAPWLTVLKQIHLYTIILKTLFK